MLIVLCGTLAGAENFVEIERWSKRQVEVLRRLLPFARGIPAHDTLNDAMNALPAGLFSDLFIAWIGALRDGDPEIVALDGKTSRRARRFPDEWCFPDLAMIGQLEASVERDGKTTTAARYYLCSAKLTAQQFAKAVRAHWGIENRLHWVMDVVFHDDPMRLRTAHGPANMATIKHAALNIIRAIPDKASLTVR